MALDRQSIEKQDFPMGRRGYDPEAVNAHLSAIADQVEELKASDGGSSASLASSAGEQVRAIVDAAERTAGEIRATAEREAKKIVADARRELRKARSDAAGEAGAQVAKLGDAAASLLKRIEAMDKEVEGVMEALRAGASRLNEDLQLVQGMLGEVKEAVAAEEKAVAAEEEEAVVASPVSSTVGADDEVRRGRTGARVEAAEDATPAPAVEADAVEAAPAAAGATAAAGAAPARQAGDEDLEGARLIALNMALNGNSREEVDRYLQDNFDLSDRGALLDDVFASVAG